MKSLLPLLLFLLPAFPQARCEEIRIHLGHAANPSEEPASQSGDRWNRVRTWGAIHRGGMIATDSAPTPIVWETIKRFSFHFNTGIEQSELGYPTIVSRHGYYLARKEKIGEDGPFHEAQVLLSELNPDHDYKLTFYGARMAAFRDDVSLNITAQGNGEETISLHLPSGGAMEQEESIARIRPNHQGVLTLRFEVLEGYNRGVINSIIVEDLSAAKSQ